MPVIKKKIYWIESSESKSPKYVTLMRELILSQEKKQQGWEYLILWIIDALGAERDHWASTYCMSARCNILMEGIDLQYKTCDISCLLVTLSQVVKWPIVPTYTEIENVVSETIDHTTVYTTMNLLLQAKSNMLHKSFNDSYSILKKSSVFPVTLTSSAGYNTFKSFPDSFHEISC